MIEVRTTSGRMDSMLFLAALAAATLAQSDVAAEVDVALGKMTQEEKLRIIGGYRGFDLQPIASLGMDSVLMSDGPVGVRNFGPTTAYASGITLASCFDPELAKEFGEAVGRDARARGVGFWLGPGVNLSRIVQNGRNFEYTGEDPFLASRCAVNIVEGVQSQGVVATIKHFAANNHENDRMTDSSDVDERVLRELYLKPFEAAVKEGHAGAVMCSYNLINGIYASADHWLLTDVLKDDWHFQGVLMSDWGAAHDRVADFNAGLDLEMPGAEFMTPTAIARALAQGKVTQETLDEKVRRILRVCYEFDLVGPKRQPIGPRDDPRNTAIARREAAEGTVLLKNNGLLPLRSRSDLNVLVLGSNAVEPVTGGGGSSYTTPLHEESLLEALKRSYPQAHTISSAAVDAENPYNFSGYQDLTVSYFRGKELAGDPVATVKETRIRHRWTPRHPSPAGVENFSARWRGKLLADASGDYVLSTRSDDGIRVDVDGMRVINNWTDHTTATDSAKLYLSKGPHDLKVEYYQGVGEAVAQLGLVSFAKLKNDPELLAAAHKADAIVIGVGFNAKTESEGLDRPFDLPVAQQMLIDQAARANRRVVLVVNSGAGVDLAPFVGKVSAIIEAWYPGQEGAAAIADIISGAVNPSGKLAATFPSKLAGTYYADAYPPVNHHVKYGEGLLTGYRWFDAKEQKPLFPFGFGLSYTSFQLGTAKLSQDGDDLGVRLDVANTGSVAGTEVVQVYVGPKHPGPGEPVKRLQGFARVTLGPGESRAVTVDVALKQLATWSTQAHRWVLSTGDYTAYVGNSSADVRSYAFKVVKGGVYRP